MNGLDNTARSTASTYGSTVDKTPIVHSTPTVRMVGENPYGGTVKVHPEGAKVFVHPEDRQRVVCTATREYTEDAKYLATRFFNNASRTDV